MARQKNFKRVISIKEVAETGHYSDMADLAKIFQHNVVEDNNGTWRWRENKIVGRLTGEPGMQFHTPPEWRGAMYNQMHVGALDLNGLALLALHGEIPLEEYMKFYMQIGYSLSGYAEVFGQREVTEYQLEYLSPPPDDWDFGNEYYQTAIEYMRLKYKGKVLQL